MAAPEPPSAMASSVVCSPRTRLKAPQLKSAGKRFPALEANALLLDSAVRSIQRNGAIVTATATPTSTQAPTRRQLVGFFGDEAVRGEFWLGAVLRGRSLSGRVEVVMAALLIPNPA